MIVILLKNPPVILREPQDERGGGLITLRIFRSTELAEVSAWGSIPRGFSAESIVMPDPWHPAPGTSPSKCLSIHDRNAQRY